MASLKQLRAFDKPGIRKENAIGGDHAEHGHFNASRRVRLAFPNVRRDRDRDDRVISWSH